MILRWEISHQSMVSVLVLHQNHIPPIIFYHNCDATDSGGASNALENNVHGPQTMSVHDTKFVKTQVSCDGGNRKLRVVSILHKYQTKHDQLSEPTIKRAIFGTYKYWIFTSLAPQPIFNDCKCGKLPNQLSAIDLSRFFSTFYLLIKSFIWKLFHAINQALIYYFSFI